MTTAKACCCIICGKETSNLGIASHIKIAHNGDKTLQLAGNSATRGAPSPLRGKPLSESHREKISKSTKGKKHKPLSDLTKLKMSESRKQLYQNGWEPTCGRCKKYEYFSSIAGNIKVDGTWELIACKYFDAMKFNWRRNKERFEYVRPNGRISTYQPDFFVEDWNAYVEVKGYETDLDKAKWNQFPCPLEILRRKEISEMDEWLKSAPC